MQIQCSGRQSGKTTKLIEFAHNKSIYIVCADKSRANFVANLATQLHKNILNPITIEELKNMVGYHHSINFVVDELGHCFQSSFSDKKFLIANLTGEGEYPPVDFDKQLALTQHLQTLVKSKNETINELQILNLGLTAEINSLECEIRELKKTIEHGN